MFAGVAGFEPASRVLETRILPLHYTPIFRESYRTCTDLAGFADLRLTIHPMILWRMWALLPPPSDCKSDALAE